jgi:hypothetical protein
LPQSLGFFSKRCGCRYYYRTDCSISQLRKQWIVEWDTGGRRCKCGNREMQASMPFQGTSLAPAGRSASARPESVKSPSSDYRLRVIDGTMLRARLDFRFENRKSNLCACPEKACSPAFLPHPSVVSGNWKYGKPPGRGRLLRAGGGYQL